MHAHLNIVRPELPRRVSEQGIEHAQALQFGGSAVDALDDSKGRVSGRVSQVTHTYGDVSRDCSPGATRDRRRARGNRFLKLRGGGDTRVPVRLNEHIGFEMNNFRGVGRGKPSPCCSNDCNVVAPSLWQG